MQGGSTAEGQPAAVAITTCAWDEIGAVLMGMLLDLSISGCRGGFPGMSCCSKALLSSVCLGGIAALLGDVLARYQHGERH